ncbi:hypothetical protein HFO56_02350 [Rhizobium laguerreae]|uniref:hypothetical protein n=1 Tax=Rhizobium laguerreae TaxID=1076926 RepID=UPI001C922AFF|nr:hypothetical protein [Rhizobium laguerreae]MBY3151226.1 hypothetical protein [Rhizobium laguerreae]
MANPNHPIEAMTREIHAMRENVAALARSEKDGLSYRAYLLQARSLLAIEEAVGRLSSDASIKAMREDMVDDAHIERYWLGMVADWLVEHERAFRDNLEGSSEKLAFLLSSADKETVQRLHVNRHHAMIETFCKNHAAVLRERCDELDGQIVAFQNMQSKPAMTSPGM